MAKHNKYWSVKKCVGWSNMMVVDNIGSGGWQPITICDIIYEPSLTDCLKVHHVFQSFSKEICKKK
jgi:hypothetical protein